MNFDYHELVDVYRKNDEKITTPLLIHSSFLLAANDVKNYPTAHRVYRSYIRMQALLRAAVQFCSPTLTGYFSFSHDRKEQFHLASNAAGQLIVGMQDNMMMLVLRSEEGAEVGALCSYACDDPGIVHIAANEGQAMNLIGVLPELAEKLKLCPAEAELQLPAAADTTENLPPVELQPEPRQGWAV